MLVWVGCLCTDGPGGALSVVLLETRVEGGLPACLLVPQRLMPAQLLAALSCGLLYAFSQDPHYCAHPDNIVRPLCTYPSALTRCLSLPAEPDGRGCLSAGAGCGLDALPAGAELVEGWGGGRGAAAGAEPVGGRGNGRRRPSGQQQRALNRWEGGTVGGGGHRGGSSGH